MAESVKKAVAKPKSAAKPRKPAARTTARAARTGISHEQVARLAHRYYSERGFEHGRDEEDWLRAESELLSQAS